MKQSAHFNPLTSEEKRVILDKGTEAPGSGEYEHLTRDGVYLCRQCNALLYDSKDKFDAHCGWPAFDDDVSGAVQKTTDADGRRTEITCAHCGGHLGHIFEGEGFTEKDTRHCVNSLSMRFVPRDFGPQEKPAIVLGGGCFWCLDASYRMISGIEDIVVGYAGGTTQNPSYEEVSSGETGHAEVVSLSYDPAKISYTDILSIFFALHDPTTPNKQGNDIGTQYRSVIFYKTWKQKEEAEQFIRTLSDAQTFEAPIVTIISPPASFFPAEEYHQNYYAKNPNQAYCQTVINPKLSKLRSHYQSLRK